MGFDRRAGSSATYAMTSKLLSASFSVVLLTIATITSTTKALPIGTRLNERAAVEEVQLLSHRYPGALMLLAQANIMEDTLLYDAIRINPTDYDTNIELLAFNITCYMYSRHLEYSQLNQSLDINNDTVNRDTIANHSGLNQIMTKKMMNLSCNYWNTAIWGEENDCSFNGISQMCTKFHIYQHKYSMSEQTSTPGSSLPTAVENSEFYTGIFLTDIVRKFTIGHPDENCSSLIFDEPAHNTTCYLYSKFLEYSWFSAQTYCDDTNSSTCTKYKNNQYLASKMMTSSCQYYWGSTNDCSLSTISQMCAKYHGCQLTNNIRRPFQDFLKTFLPNGANLCVGTWIATNLAQDEEELITNINAVRNLRDNLPACS